MELEIEKQCFRTLNQCLIIEMIARISEDDIKNAFIEASFHFGDDDPQKYKFHSQAQLNCK